MIDLNNLIQKSLAETVERLSINPPDGKTAIATAHASTAQLAVELLINYHSELQRELKKQGIEI